MKQSSGSLATLVALVVAFAGASGTLRAYAQGRQPPLPPPRPATLGQPAASTPAQPPSPASAKADEPLDLDHPPMLPAASKKRMSECGREWEAIKKAGKDNDIGWREFATRCLTR